MYINFVYVTEKKNMAKTYLSEKPNCLNTDILVQIIDEITLAALEKVTCVSVDFRMILKLLFFP